jgi:hypothetical protein
MQQQVFSNMKEKIVTYQEDAFIFKLYKEILNDISKKGGKRKTR